MVRNGSGAEWEGRQGGRFPVEFVVCEMKKQVILPIHLEEFVKSTVL